ncbi:MAG: hypothetical protein EXQ83_13845, partial [Xanthobacteraceae bacterium]|nr:hypothetical protein [Xanthobacteraceae bacterium]
MPFIFYDTETTGTRTSFDQILQFAAIKTDDDLNVLETFDIRCRLLPYIVPSPGALLVTGVSVAEITTCPTSHFEMMRRIRSKMDAWSQGGAVFIGWNSMRFDETLLRQAYYQTLLPVYQTNTNGNGRADMMRVVQVVAACAPNMLAVPLQPDGKATFKLGLVAAANGIVLENAHEALADTNATLGVARLIKQRVPSLWEALINNARKNDPLRLMRSEPVLLLSENFFGSSYNSIVTPVAANVDNANEWGVFDLQFDPLQYLGTSDDDLRNSIDGKVKVIRRVSINSQPGLLPIAFAPDDVRGGRQYVEIYQARARLIGEHSLFRKRVGVFLAERFTNQPEKTHVEERIYSGFPSNDDQERLSLFHKGDWDERVGIIGEIEDDRYRQLGLRILATECPEKLTAKQRQQWSSWRRERLLAEGDMPWLTVG